MNFRPAPVEDRFLEKVSKGSSKRRAQSAEVLMSAEPKVFIPTAPCADHGICERCEEAKGVEMYLDRLLCAKCYDESTIGEPHEDYRAEFEQWLDDIDEGREADDGDDEDLFV